MINCSSFIIQIQTDCERVGYYPGTFTYRCLPSPTRKEEKKYQKQE